MSDQPEILREYRVTLNPSTDRAQSLTNPKNLGLKTKFGGVPDQVQASSSSRVACPECGHHMHFIAQIDSFEHKSSENPNARDYGEQHFMFGDVGMIYVWFCFDCLTPLATMDSY
jgi:hypothetical protein